MISFVWSARYPFMAGAGGSENYTAGHIRELTRRGIPCRLITIGYGEQDGRQDFPDITFKSIASKEELSTLDDTLVFVTYPLRVKTKRQSYVILHCPPMAGGVADPMYDYGAMAGKKLIAPSKFAGKLWAKELGRPLWMPTVYPFADTAFSKVQRKPHTNRPLRILYASRLTPDKGVYTLLAALHLDGMRDEVPYQITATSAGDHTPTGKIIRDILKAHPQINVIPAGKSPEEMATIMADHDVVVMPSTNLFWKEVFGFLSVEAQHAGCRVVASKAGGLPETNCGGLILTKPDDPLSLARGLVKAAHLGPLTATERARAQRKFTLEASVNSLLSVIDYGQKTLRPRMGPVRLAPLSQLGLFADHSMQAAYLRASSRNNWPAR